MSDWTEEKVSLCRPQTGTCTRVGTHTHTMLYYYFSALSLSDMSKDVQSPRMIGTLTWSTLGAGSTLCLRTHTWLSATHQQFSWWETHPWVSTSSILMHLPFPNPRPYKPISSASFPRTKVLLWHVAFSIGCGQHCCRHPVFYNSAARWGMQETSYPWIGEWGKQASLWTGLWIGMSENIRHLFCTEKVILLVMDLLNLIIQKEHQLLPSPNIRATPLVSTLALGSARPLLMKCGENPSKLSYCSGKVPRVNDWTLTA